jgi:hypothetical protein
MSPGDSDNLLARELEEPLGSDLAAQEWTDDFSAQTRPARKTTTSTMSDSSTTATTEPTSTEPDLPATPATQFTISDLDGHEQPVDVPEDRPESGIALLSAELPDTPAFEPGETVTASHAVAGEPMMEPNEIGEPLAIAAETTAPPIPPESGEDSGFFRHIFIDDGGRTQRLRAQGNAKPYSGIRRLFHHPDAKTRYRSHSKFSRQFQSQPRDE